MSTKPISVKTTSVSKGKTPRASTATVALAAEMDVRENGQAKASVSSAKSIRARGNGHAVELERSIHAAKSDAAKSDAAKSDAPQGLGFPVVAIGASAGGLDAFTKLIQRLPPDTDMAFIVVQHLDPTHESLLAPLLARACAMTVAEVRDGVHVKPNRVYVIPPNTKMSISLGVLRLEPRRDRRGSAKPIDHLFTSLAADQGAGAIGIVLSGADDDGTLGLEAIRAGGGVAIAQDPNTAAYPEMPRSAIATGEVDLVLSPPAIADELIRMSRKPLDVIENGDGGEQIVEGWMNRIFVLLRIAKGVDFRQYKLNTITRRIGRRMAVNRCDTHEAYAALLETKPQELQALYDDILINVTEFFRDPETFRALKRHVFPRMLKARTPGTPLRIWVPGCSTGEEAFSLAMTLAECLDGAPAEPVMQIFGTDIDEGAIARARAAIYPVEQVGKLSKDRIRRFFAPVEGGYQIETRIRESCLFARHNLLADPPFSRLDLISCRNLLIYLQPVWHRKLIPVFHYALKPGGTLMLGNSESIQGFAECFDLVEKTHRFYTRSASAGAIQTVPSVISQGPAPAPVSLSKVEGPDWTEASLQRAVDRIIVTKHAPPGVVVSSRLDVVQSHGDLNPFLRLPTGAASHNILKMAPDGLRAEIAMLLTKTISAHKPRTALGYVEHNGDLREVNLAAYPLLTIEGKDQRYLVLFNLAARTITEAAEGLADGDDLPVRPIGPKKLAVTREYMDSLLMERDSAMQDLTALHEEVQSGNEELQSANEELQSTNEELQTAKEELQATIEELNTINDELQGRNGELGRLNDDLTNLISSTTMPIVILDNELKVRRITPAAETLMNLRASDIGRPLTDIRMKLSVEDLEPTLRDVAQTLETREVEIQDRDRRWHCLRVRPYRTADNRIEGLVLVMMDITEQKEARQVLAKERTRLIDTLAHESSQLARADKSLAVEKVGRKVTESALHDSEGALLRSRRELRALAGRLFSAQDEERRRISRELHDDLSQKIAHIEFDVDLLGQRLPADPKEVTKRLEAVRKQVESFSGDLRRIAYQLHPSALDHLGLAVALRSLTAEFARREGVAVNCTCRAVPASLTLAVGASIYRIVQEALHNIAKHAGKNPKVTVKLIAAKGVLQLSIRDSGAGFDPASLKKNKGLGLLSMQERVRLIHGVFAYESRPGRGVVIRIRVPISKEKRK